MLSMLLLPLPFESFVVRDDSLVYRRGRKEHEILLSEVHEVYQSTTGIVILKAGRRRDIAGAAVRVPSRTRGYESLLASIRVRAAGALWVDLDGPEPATAPDKAAYLTGKILLIRHRKNKLGVLLAAVSAPFVGFGIWDIARNGLADARIILIWLAMLYCLPYTLIMLGIRRQARSLGNFRRRLSSLQSEGKDGTR